MNFIILNPLAFIFKFLTFYAIINTLLNSSKFKLREKTPIWICLKSKLQKKLVNFVSKILKTKGNIAEKLVEENIIFLKAYQKNITVLKFTGYNKMENILKKRYIMYRNGAKARKIFFDLNINDFMIFWKKPCHYCGDKIDTIGLDRINNDKGYNIDNVIPCCTMCNRMKMNYGTENFINHCRKIIRCVGKWKL